MPKTKIEKYFWDFFQKKIGKSKILKNRKIENFENFDNEKSKIFEKS